MSMHSKIAFSAGTNRTAPDWFFRFLAMERVACLRVACLRVGCRLTLTVFSYSYSYSFSPKAGLKSTASDQQSDHQPSTPHHQLLQHPELRTSCPGVSGYFFSAWLNGLALDPFQLRRARLAQGRHIN